MKFSLAQALLLLVGTAQAMTLAESPGSARLARANTPTIGDTQLAMPMCPAKWPAGWVPYEGTPGVPLSSGAFTTVDGQEVKMAIYVSKSPQKNLDIAGDFTAGGCTGLFFIGSMIRIGLQVPPGHEDYAVGYLAQVAEERKLTQEAIIQTTDKKLAKKIKAAVQKEIPGIKVRTVEPSKPAKGKGKGTGEASGTAGGASA